jgi:hypothetical protein
VPCSTARLKSALAYRRAMEPVIIGGALGSTWGVCGQAQDVPGLRADLAEKPLSVDDGAEWV